MCRQMFNAPAARPSPTGKAAYRNSKTTFVNHAEKQHAALKHKSSKDKEQEHDWTDEELRALFLGPWSMCCMEMALFQVQHDWVMEVLEERKRNGNVFSFGKHYLGLPGWDKPEFPRKPPYAWFNKKSQSAPVAAEAQVTKPALATSTTTTKPVQPAADSSAVQTLSINNNMQAADQQADPKQAEPLGATATTTSSSDSQQDTSSTKDNSSVTVLPSPVSSIQETPMMKTTSSAFLTKIKGWFNSLLASEFEVTISF